MKLPLLAPARTRNRNRMPRMSMMLLPLLAGLIATVAITNMLAWQIMHIIPRNTALITASTSSWTPTAVAESSPFLPDWRIVTDCSTYNADCPVRFKTTPGLRLGEYPFDVSKHNKYNYVRVKEGEFPTEWTKALESDAPPLLVDDDLPPMQLDEEDRLSSLIFPPSVPKEQSTLCLSRAKLLSFDEQMNYMLSMLQPLQDVNTMVAWTMTDEKYSKEMLHDVWEMSNDIVGFNDAFFFVAMDEYTVQLACQHGYRFVSAPAVAEQSSNHADLKSMVESTKFEVSRALVDRGQNFFFYEMDCWFIASPLPLLRQQRTDLLMSAHQYIPGTGNIGIYAVMANNATRGFFRQCIELLAVSNKTHDQIVFNDLVSLHMDIIHGKILAGDATPKDYFKQWNVLPDKIPIIKYAMTRAFFGRNHIVSFANPTITEHTVAVHILESAPLKEPHGKKMMAKELGLYTGFSGTSGGYYRRKGQRRRYLMIDGGPLGSYNLVGDDSFYDFEALKWTIATLVALCRRTDRIFVLPRIFFPTFLWKLLDLKTLEPLVHIRETNFPSNKKAWYHDKAPFRSVARTALFNDRGHDGPGRLFAQVMDGQFMAWEVEGNSQGYDALFAVSSQTEGIHDTEALFVNTYFTSKDVKKFQNRTQGKGHEASVGRAEAEIKYVFERLKWCKMTMKDAIKPFLSTASADDCYGRGTMG